MKKIYLRPIVGLCLLSMGFPICAEPATTDNELSNREASVLASQIKQLQQEVNTLKEKVETKPTARHIKKHSSSPVVLPPAPAIPDPPATPVGNDILPELPGPNSLPQNLRSTTYMPVDLDVPGQAFVSSGPYLGISLEYSGSNLIINSPSVNADVVLLKLRQNIHRRLEALGIPQAEDRSHLLLSGYVEAQAMYKNRGGNSSQSNIDLTAANLDAYFLGPSRWTSGLIEFAYDNDIGANEGSLFNRSRTENSRVFINKAFLIIGDFTKSPFYGSAGQMYVPFGVYSTTMISSPLTKFLGRTKARAINFGYQQQSPQSLFAAAYIFKGDSRAASGGRVNNGGFNLGFRGTGKMVSGTIGAGIIGNIADSQGMQNNGLQVDSLFGGFGATGTCASATGACGNEKLVHRIPGYNFNLKLSIAGDVDFLAEYIAAGKKFNPNDLALNNRSAIPQAFHTEAVYSFQTLSHPTSISVGFDATKDALALGLPAKRYSLALNTSLWRNTLETIELRHDIDYSGNVTSAGSTAPGPQGTGRSNSAITAQIDLYF